MKDKVAIVTGASNGMGAATARLLAERGARVILADVDTAAGEKVAAGIGAAACFRRHDVSDEKSWIGLMEFAQKTYGGVQILVNDAAIALFKTLDQTSYDEWLQVMRVNAGGVFLGCKYGLAAMQEKGGAIVNVSSNSSLIGMRSVAAYTMTKGAINSFTRAVAAHCRLGKIPVRCNTVIPAGTRSKMLRDTFLQMSGIDVDQDTPEAAALLATVQAPEAVASAIVYLASDEAYRINGAELVVDGAESFTYPA